MILITIYLERELRSQESIILLHRVYGKKSRLEECGFGRPPLMKRIVTSYIAWEWGCAYIYKHTILDTTRFKAVMTMNLLELRS